MRCLKFSLTEDSYNRAVNVYADIVISCGSSLSAVNIFLTHENNAKNVILMKPGIVGTGRFDVAIIPRHDRPKEKSNTVITEGAPNTISGAAMERGARNIRGVTALGSRKKIGLLVGGGTPEYEFAPGLAGELIGQIEGALEELDMDLLVTTSRRTPEAIEVLFKARLGKNPRCKMFLIANEKNIDDAVGGILELCDIIIVSGESISMVSEAASSGKRVLAFNLERKKNKGFSKHEYAVNRLAGLGYLKRTPVNRMRRAIIELSREKSAAKKLDNTGKMCEKLFRII